MSDLIVVALVLVAFMLLAAKAKKFVKLAIAILIFAGIFFLHHLGIF